MKTINLPEGNAFGVDDVESDTPIVDYAERQAKTLFFVWVTLTQQKRVILGERRGEIEVQGPSTFPNTSTISVQRSSSINFTRKRETSAQRCRSSLPYCRL